MARSAGPLFTLIYVGAMLMDPRFLISSKLLTEYGWKAEERLSREYTTAELDAIADFSWPWERLQRAVRARTQTDPQPSGAFRRGIQRFARVGSACRDRLTTGLQKLTWRDA